MDYAQEFRRIETPVNCAQLLSYLVPFEIGQ